MEYFLLIEYLYPIFNNTDDDRQHTDDRVRIIASATVDDNCENRD